MGDVDVYKQEEADRPVERSPRGRYIRFDIRLGSGAYKTVYKAYDTDQGIDVAWNAIDIGVLPASEKARIIQEVQLLQRLEHKNIINFYGSWFSKEKNQVVFITEIMTSGNLKSYIKRVHFVKWKIIKRWCIQILEGLHYLHSQNPPVIHRDLKCDNIFINGNTGDLRIGDLGLSTQLAVHKRSKAQSVLGTPEFMAPELYDESYDEKVDIYAFGMCVLEMVTKEVPYSECINPAQIYKKVTAGIRPRGLQRIISQPAREFIELCLSRGNGKIDVSAEYLLNHPFLKAHDDDGEMVQVLDEDELERDSTPAPPASPPMNPKQFADQLNMESGSKGKDESVISERRKNNSSLSLEPGDLATGSANSSMTSPGSAAQRNESAAEEKSAGKHRVLLPPSIASTTTASNDIGVSPQAKPGSVLPPSAPVSGTSEPVVDEPLSDKKGEIHHVENFLSGLPPTETNIRNDRIAVMGGRGQRIEIDEAQAYADDISVPAAVEPASQNDVERGTVVNAALTESVSADQGVVGGDNSMPPINHSPDQAPPTTVSASTTPTQSHISERSTATAVSASSDSNLDSRPRANTIDQSRTNRPTSASTKPRKRYDIKATKDPDNEHSILLNLRMALDGKSKEIKFPFNLFTDSSHEVACELAVDVGILEPDLEDIADSISFLVTEGKINNLPDFDQDVWDEAPEPHSFPSKPLPHVSKLTFESSLVSHAIMSSPLDTGIAPIQNASGIPVGHIGARDSSSLVNLDANGSRIDSSAATESNFVVGSPTPFERNLSPPIGVPHMTHAASESAMFHPDGPKILEHSISMGSASDANYMQTVRQHEDRMKLARSSYDERESSLEEAMRTQEEKHQREIERIRMKMQEFNEKTARATMARQERMRLGTDEFRDDGGAGMDDGRPNALPLVANDREPEMPQAASTPVENSAETESISSNPSSVRSPHNTAAVADVLDQAISSLSLSPPTSVSQDSESLPGGTAAGGS